MIKEINKLHSPHDILYYGNIMVIIPMYRIYPFKRILYPLSRKVNIKRGSYDGIP